jgi:hypothetical protein
MPVERQFTVSVPSDDSCFWCDSKFTWDVVRGGLKQLSINSMHDACRRELQRDKELLQQQKATIEQLRAQLASAMSKVAGDALLEDEISQHELTAPQRTAREVFLELVNHSWLDKWKSMTERLSQSWCAGACNTSSARSSRST